MHSSSLTSFIRKNVQNAGSQAPSQMPGTVLRLTAKCSTPKRRPFGGKGALTYPVQIIFIICTVYITKIIYTTKRNEFKIGGKFKAWIEVGDFLCLLFSLAF